MKLIDFDRYFQSYVADWIKKNRSSYKNMDELEEQVPELYLRWLNEPAVCPFYGVVDSCSVL